MKLSCIFFSFILLSCSTTKESGKSSTSNGGGVKSRPAVQSSFKSFDQKNTQNQIAPSNSKGKVEEAPTKDTLTYKQN